MSVEGYGKSNICAGVYFRKSWIRVDEELYETLKLQIAATCNVLHPARILYTIKE
uniref:Uncharacterized protein n=1 Tax=Schistosoma curassoni TaxID=6186 RepID=A0A183KN05_9TREM